MKQKIKLKMPEIPLRTSIKTVRPASDSEFG